MFVCCECCVLSGRGFCDELITRPEESYRLWCVVVCDLENLKNEEAMTRVGSQGHSKKKLTVTSLFIVYRNDGRSAGWLSLSSCLKNGPVSRNITYTSSGPRIFEPLHFAIHNLAYLFHDLFNIIFQSLYLS